MKADVNSIEYKLSRLAGIPLGNVPSFCETGQHLLTPEIENETIYAWLKIYLQKKRLPVSSKDLALFIASHSDTYSLPKKSYSLPGERLVPEADLVERPAQRLRGKDNGSRRAAKSLIADMKMLKPRYLADTSLFLWAVKKLSKEDRLSAHNIVNLMDQVLHRPHDHHEHDYTYWEISTPMGTGGKRG
jgi:hypothetical protein